MGVISVLPVQWNTDMTSLLHLSTFLVVAVAAAYGIEGYEGSYEDSGESYFSGSTSYDGFGSEEAKSLPNKRDSGYDADNFIPSVGNNNDYSGFRDGYQGPTSHEGNGAVSFSQVVANHRPVQRVHATHRLAAEATNVIEKPVPLPVKAVPQYSHVPFPVVPAYNSAPIYPFLPLAPVAPAIIAPVKYPVQFFKPISYQPQPKPAPVAPVKHEQPDYVLTKVPLVYHATYAETPLGQSSFGANNAHQGESHPQSGFSDFDHSNRNSFNQDSSFNAGAQHINSVVSPSSHVPAPLLPTPTPYYNQQHRHQ